jgi:hypothetical protein
LASRERGIPYLRSIEEEGTMEAHGAVAGTTIPGSYPLGVGRPPLNVDDLPTPEEAFQAKRIGLKETIALVIGPI